LIPVVVISLERSAGRRSAMRTHLDGLGIPFVFFDGVDGQRMSPEEVAALDVRPVAAKYGRPLSRGEIGVAASFIKVFRSIAVGPAPFVCVLEDDVHLLQGVTEFLSEENLSTLPEFDVLRLFRGSSMYGFRAAPVADFGGIRVYAPFRSSHGAAAQVISRAGAARLVRHVRTLRAPMDDLIYRYPAFGSRILDIRPPVVEYEGDVPSLIGDERDRLDAVNRRSPVRIAGKILVGFDREWRRWPSYIAAWGPKMAMRLRKPG
jgi:glycosyl transferase family 25